MAIAFDAAPGPAGGGAATSSLTWSHTCTGSNLVLVTSILLARAVTGAAPTSCTYNGVAMTISTTSIFATGTGDLYIAYLAGPATGANNIVWNFSSVGILGTTGFSESITGAAQSGLPDAVNTTSAATGTTFNSTINVVAANSWVIGQIVNDTGPISITAPATLRVNNGSQVFADSNATVSTGTYTLTATAGANSNWGGLLTSFSPVNTDSVITHNLSLLGAGT